MENQKNSSRSVWFQVRRLVFFIIILNLTFLKSIFNAFIDPDKINETSVFAKIVGSFERMIKALDISDGNSILLSDLIDISLANMKVKKSRSITTIGGMAIGIGTIVFLVSIGYGLQELVVGRVASLEEMRQTEVAPQVGGKLKITDESLNKFKEIKNVDAAIPMISVVGKVKYKESLSDMVVYGVTSEYLTHSTIDITTGKAFENNDLILKQIKTDNSGVVAGVSDELKSGDVVGEYLFTLLPTKYYPIYSKPEANSPILGYTKRAEGTYQGLLIMGDKSDQWLKSEFMIWNKQGEQYVVKKNSGGYQVRQVGYISSKVATIVETLNTKISVLGASTLDKVILDSELKNDSQDVKKVSVASYSAKEILINKTALNILGLKEEEAVGQKISLSFVVVGDLLESRNEKIESLPIDYTIVGVTGGDKTPVIYLPFIDLRSIGISNYSQAKILVKGNDALSNVRKSIEASGYVTHSVADTVDQINSIFGTARILLAVLGFVALIVAALGMFNTLTVSLLERTREVGLMKAMGMKSHEVSELFLTESMIIGFSGGVLGIILGVLCGKLLGVVLSMFSVFKGQGFIDVSYLPLTFVILILGLSLLVGIFTGRYPAKRATEISVLNALRYE